MRFAAELKNYAANLPRTAADIPVKPAFPLRGGLQESVRKMLKKGFSPEIVAETLEIPVEDVRKVAESK